MDRWVGKVAVVTGASSGIGESIAVTLAQKGMRVIGLARRLEKLQAIAKRLEHAKGTFYPIQCDITKEKEILEAFKFARDLDGVDVLVNNAGLTFPETIIDGKTEHFQNILDVNVLAVAICTREATKSMRERNAEGHIININSIAGHQVPPKYLPLSLYQASKYAITAMTKVLKNEITFAKIPIKVTSLSPGLVKTEMPIIMAYGGEKLFNEHPYVYSQDVADAVLYLLGTPPHVEIAELTIDSLWSSA